MERVCWSVNRDKLYQWANIRGVRQLPLAPGQETAEAPRRTGGEILHTAPSPSLSALPPPITRDVTGDVVGHRLSEIAAGILRPAAPPRRIKIFNIFTSRYK
ncbi:hypothetical protein J6590_003347 [Homalodisca vitripennis]|nr:hypothetical protein J6590_003347 [Homalodisca vitripennis]